MPTTNMNLTLPQVLGTPGPQYAGQINTALQRVDTHDHTAGFGTPVPTAGLNINATLPLNGNAATGIRLLQLLSQAVAPDGVVFPRSMYVRNGELCYLNNDGITVQLTTGTTLNPAGTGGFGGDYATSGAVAEYQSSQSRYTFKNPNASLADLYGRAANLSTTLAVTGAATLGASLTVATTLGVTGATTLAGVTTGNASVGGTLGVSGATTLGTTLTVTGATGLASATLSGTLGVTGNTTLSSALGVTGATTLSGTLAVSGATTLSTTLGVTGNTSLSSVTVSTNLNAPDATTTLGTTSATNVSISGTLGVTGALTASALTANGAVTMNSTLSMPTASLVSIGATAAARVQMQAGVLTATKLQSSVGMPSMLSLGHLLTAAGATYAGSSTRVAAIDAGTGAASGQVAVETMSFAGSIIGKAATVTGQAIPAGQTAKVDIYKNAVLLWTGTAQGPTGAGVSITEAAAKNTYAFVAGDRLEARITTSYASTGAWRVNVTLEMDNR